MMRNLKTKVDSPSDYPFPCWLFDHRRCLRTPFFRFWVLWFFNRVKVTKFCFTPGLEDVAPLYHVTFQAVRWAGAAGDIAVVWATRTEFLAWIAVVPSAYPVHFSMSSAQNVPDWPRPTSLAASSTSYFDCLAVLFSRPQGLR